MSHIRSAKKHQILNSISPMLIEYYSPINLNYFWNGSRSYCGGPFSPIDDKKSIDSKKSIKTETSRFPGAQPKMAKKILIEKFDIKNGTGSTLSKFFKGPIVTATGMAILIKTGAFDWLLQNPTPLPDMPLPEGGSSGSTGDSAELILGSSVIGVFLLKLGEDLKFWEKKGPKRLDPIPSKSKEEILGSLELDRPGFLIKVPKEGDQFIFSSKGKCIKTAPTKEILGHLQKMPETVGALKLVPIATKKGFFVKNDIFRNSKK